MVFKLDYKVSVIVPVYNREKTIERAIESVLRQTLDGIELILVDDGSSDNSVAIMQEYQEKYNNIKLFQQENSGPGIARNKGIENANGKYIIFLDSDDWIPEHAYKSMYEVAEEKNADIIVGQLLRKINNGSWYNPPKIKECFDKLKGKNCAQRYELAVVNPSSCNRFIKRTFMEENKIKFNGSKMGEDMVFNLKLFECAESIYTVDEIVYMYETNFQEQNSQVAKINYDVINSGIDTLKSYVMFFEKKGLIDLENQNLLGLFHYVLERFWKMEECDEKSLVFENIKEYLKNFEGKKQYKLTLEYLMGMDLDILLCLPYETYKIQKELLQKNLEVKTQSDTEISKNSKEQVLEQYRTGKLGFRYILRCMNAWAIFKLKRVRKTNV